MRTIIKELISTSNKGFIISTFVILISTFLVVRNSFTQGMYPTHDGNIHMVRTIHFFSEINRGQFPVRMVPDLAYTYGYPVFNFFYPLPYYVSASVQSLGFDAVTSWQIMQAGITLLSVTTFYLWVRAGFDRSSALVAAVIYAWIPYRFLTLYVTGQIGGYYALLFAPLIGLGLHKILATKNQTLGGVLLAIGIAGLITSHLISIIIFFLPLFSYGLWLLYKNLTKEKIMLLIMWSSLGIGLSAFYLFPFMLEKDWIKLGHGIMIDHRNHWPSIQQLVYSPWGHGYSNPGNDDGLSYQVGMALFFTILVGVLLFIRKFIQKRIPTVSLALVMLINFFIIIFIMTPLSSPVWDIVKPLQFLQFPWRLLAASSLVGAWLVAWVVSEFKGSFKILLIVMLIGIAAYNSKNYTRPWPLDHKTEQDYINDSAAYYSSTDTNWELLPNSVHEVPKTFPPEVLRASESAVVINNSVRPEQGAIRQNIDFTASESAVINLAVWNYPLWHVEIDNQTVKTTEADDGTILVPVRPGQSDLQISLKHTKTQRFSDFITVASAGIIILLLVRSRKESDRLI